MSKKYLILAIDVLQRESDDRIQTVEWGVVVESRPVEVVEAAHAWVAWSGESRAEAERELGELRQKGEYDYSLAKLDG